MSILTWNTWKSLPLRMERIPDAIVPIGIDLDLRQAWCEYGKENFERRLLYDDAHKNHCISMNMSRICVIEYLNHISMI
jgi:hypothetical protein